MILAALVVNSLEISGPGIFNSILFVLGSSISMVTTNSLLRSCIVALALVCTGATAFAAAIPQRTLANGMKIIVKEDHRSPVAVSMVWYRAGSMDEVSGTTGVAHMLEHMMFKGTQKVPVGEFSRTIARAGGRENAFTSRDYTAYYEQLHKSRLPLALELEADRMVNLSLAGDEFAKELKVVMEERRSRTDDDPHSQFLQRTATDVVWQCGRCTG